MAAYTWDGMTDIHLAYGTAEENGRMAQRLYQERFPNRRLPHHSTFASINRQLRETCLLNVSRHDCGLGGGGDCPHSEVLGSGLEYGCWHTVNRHTPSLARHTCISHRSCISSSFTRIIGKKFRQCAQRTTPGNRILVGSFSSAVLQSLGSPASCSTHMRRPLLEIVLSTAIATMFGQMKIRTQHLNKATSKDFPSMSGVVLFMIF
jgi:hypothetical protein